MSGSGISTSATMKHARRLLVARLRLRGMTQREIRCDLAREPEDGGLRNPKTGKPYSLGTVNNDCRHLDKRWKEEAAADIALMVARQIAELREARRVAWNQDDVGEVRLNIALESDLTGTREQKADLEVTLRVRYEDE